MQRRPDITRAKALLDWEPTIALEPGLVKTIAYFEALLAGGGRSGLSPAARRPARAPSPAAPGRRLRGSARRHAQRPAEPGRAPATVAGARGSRWRCAVLPREQRGVAGEGVAVALDEADARGEPAAVSRVIEFGEKRWCTSGSSTKAIGPRWPRRITKSQSSIGGRVRVEAAELEEDVAAHDEGLGRDQVVDEQRREDVALGRDDRRVGHVAQPQPLAGAVVEPAEGQEAAVGADEAGGRRAVSRAICFSSLRRQPFVVAVLEGDPGAAGRGDAEVARRRRRPGCAGRRSAAAAGPRPRRRPPACRRVEPSSTTISSKSVQVWRSTLSMAARIEAARGCRRG